MKIALIQVNAGISKQTNIIKAREKTQIAADRNADFILLPEVFNYRGPLSGQELFNEIAEEIPGESLLPLIDIAKNNELFILAGSIYERANDKKKVYNTSVLIDNSGTIIAKYRKINLFRAFIDGKEIDEANTYEPGDKTIICNINGRKVGLSICFDLRFPELYREYYKKGVDIISVPSSFTTRTGQLHWDTLLRARAIENYCYVLAPNQFGIDGNGVETYGHSMVVDPQGKIVDILDKQEEGILIVELFFNQKSNY